MRFPPEWAAELLVVDNGSTDDTAGVVENAALGNMQVRYLFEPGKGLSRARNAGLGGARGELILFTDDDVMPAQDWAMEMMLPLLEGACDAVTGKITLDPNLTRHWLTSAHRWWLASSEDARPHEGFRELIGANMGFRRSVFERVPAFDTELGAGTSGFSDDTLFGWQLVEAGFPDWLRCVGERLLTTHACRGFGGLNGSAPRADVDGARRICAITGNILISAIPGCASSITLSSCS